ncbi:kinesin-like protein KIN-14C isoform X3 [Medicago truncatula]|uniref:kinesin-like protein KIN-14C isoform X3 n=1 Tax=Medicago truncatula TaxID=3880 RepID=UPI000D2F32FC|nr:kinesin-like protein KIN-14C isoform X3 [Medicago truncatula]
MNPPSGIKITVPRELGSPKDIFNGIDRVGHVVNTQCEVEAKHRSVLVQWLNSLLPSLDFSTNVTDGELRACLSSGTVLCQILNKLRPGPVTMVSESDHSLPSQSENVKTFLKALDGLGLPRFEISDLEKGSMKPVVDCLLILRAKSLMNSLGDNASLSNSNASSPRGYGSSSFHSSPPFGVDNRKLTSESRFQRVMSFSPSMAEPSASLIYQVGHKFHEVFQIKPGSYSDLPAAKISEMMKSNSLDNAPTQSLLSVVNGILEESVERRNGEIPHRVACLLRKVSQEIERRISTQAEHIRTQSNLFKAREEKYQSRIRVLEALASGTREESEMISSQLQQLKDEKVTEEEKKENEKEIIRLTKMLEDKNLEISELKQKLEATKKTYEAKCSQLEEETRDAKAELRQKSQEYEYRLEELRNAVKEIEDSSDSKYQEWRVKENQLQTVINCQFSSLQKLKSSWESIKQDAMKGKTVYVEECNRLRVNLKPLIHASQNYQAVLAENKKMFNEVQELKGNIRVFCRIRPFLIDKKEKQSIVEDIGESDLVVVNPSKEGKDVHRSFKFNKIFGPAATQGDVYADIQPFVRSVLDGYNVCIFAYGQTGSGKTYTMTGPNGATSEKLGVNYRALNDLFRISTSRGSLIDYEIWVQMVEIYNEQVRDLLSTEESPKRLGILTQSQSYGIAVPDASMFPVKSPSDVIKLMDIGLKNRAIGSTAMNERSSRSHSVVSIHVRGKDFKSGSTMHGNLHLVDLAGSERVDRSDVTGDRLKEAQHINKSLSALGDVIFALSQKSPHVPYRNSKLTQLLQTSLGGQAKTLMFVQINSDVSSYSETLSTLKFAERVSSVELGAARNNKETRELSEQVTSMKNTILKKDEEIERLKSLNASIGGISKQIQKVSSGSFKHLVEGDIKQQMDDHKTEYLRSPEKARRVTQGVSATDFQQKSSDFSDNKESRLKSLNKSVSGISKQIQKVSSGSFKHLVEGDIKQQMDDHKTEYFRSPEKARRVTQGVSATDFQQKSSDFSDNKESRLKSLNKSVSGISKHIQKVSSGSFKHLVEGDIKQRMDDHKTEFLRSPEKARQVTRGVSATDFQQKSSDFSDNKESRLKSLNKSVSGISKQIQKVSSGSFKHLVEGDTKQRMDDHKTEFLHSPEKARRVTQGVSATYFQQRSSDFSDNNSLALGTETDGSSDSSSMSEAKKTSDKSKTSKVISRTVQAVRKFGRISSTTAVAKDPSKKSSGTIKSPSIGTPKAPKRWQ